jgi:hypothetical protein
MTADRHPGLVCGLLIVLSRRCELREPRKSGRFVEPSLCRHDRSEGSKPVGTGTR